MSTEQQNLTLGCILSIAGNLLISCSLNVQKYTHMRTEKTGSTVHYLRQPLWWLGFVLMVIGEIGNFSAYGFAPASLVAPLGTTTVIANMFIAACFLKERIYPSDIFGCMIAVLGAFLLVTYSNKTESVLDAVNIMHHLVGTAFLVYMAIEVSVMILLFVLKLHYKINSVLILIPITAIIASFTVISAKAVSGMIQLTFEGHMQLNYAIFYVLVVVMIVTGVIQVKFLNEALKLYDATTVVPINFVFFTMSAIVSGIVFYNEFWNMPLFDIVMFLIGCGLCFIGVYFISASRTTSTPLSAVNGQNNTSSANRNLKLSERLRKLCQSVFGKTMRTIDLTSVDEGQPFINQTIQVLPPSSHARTASNVSNASRTSTIKNC